MFVIYVHYRLQDRIALDWTGLAWLDIYYDKEGLNSATSSASSTELRTVMVVAINYFTYYPCSICPYIYDNLTYD